MIGLICAVAIAASVHNANVVCQAEEELYRIAEDHDIPWEVLVAIGIHESRWTVSAVNPKTGARGIFQQIPRWSPLGWRDLSTLQGSLDGLWHTLDWIRSWPRAGQTIPEILCTYGTGKARWCQSRMSGNQYSRVVERISGELFLLSAMMEER